MATAKAKNDYGVLEGTIVFAKIAQSDKKYQSEDREYSITVIVDEDTADEWDAKFKKQPSKKIKASEFEEKYKTACPIKGAKNVFAITLKKDATKNGEPFNPEYRPKVFLDTAEERVEITESRLIANGSYGKVSYRITENSFGTFARLNNVLMTEEGFKEYVSTGGGKAGSEFGDTKPVRKEEARKEATEARQDKPKKGVKQEPKDNDVDPDDLSDAPF